MNQENSELEKNESVQNNNFPENNNNILDQEQPVVMAESVNEDKLNNDVEKSGKSYCGLLITFMVISLLLAGYIVYDKVVKKEEIKEPPVVDNKQEEQPNQSKVDNGESTTIKVVDAYHSSDEYLIIPKLTGSSTNVLAFNEMLKSKVINAAKVTKDYLIETLESDQELKTYLEKLKALDYEINDLDSAYKFVKFLHDDFGLSEALPVNYNSYFKNDIIALDFSTTMFCNATCFSNAWYFYDVKNDREITSLEEVIEKLDATLNGEKIKDKNSIKDIFNDCFKTEFDENNNMNISTEVAC